MKKEIKIYFLATIMILAGNITVNAQKKASERSFAEEVRKLNEKRAARYAYINKMRAAMANESQGTTPSTPVINQPSGIAGNTVVPAPPSQVSPNLKPSQQPVRMPKQPIAQQQ